MKNKTRNTFMKNYKYYENYKYHYWNYYWLYEKMKYNFTFKMWYFNPFQKLFNQIINLNTCSSVENSNTKFIHISYYL